MVVFRATALVPVKDSGRGVETEGEKALAMPVTGNETQRGPLPKVTQHQLPVRRDSTAPRVVAGAGAAPARFRGSACTFEGIAGGALGRQDGATAHRLLAAAQPGLLTVRYCSYLNQVAAA